MQVLEVIDKCKAEYFAQYVPMYEQLKRDLARLKGAGEPGTAEEPSLDGLSLKEKEPPREPQKPEPSADAAPPSASAP